MIIDWIMIDWHWAWILLVLFILALGGGCIAADIDWS